MGVVTSLHLDHSMTLAATLALMSAGNDQYLPPVPELSSKPAAHQ